MFFISLLEGMFAVCIPPSSPLKEDFSRRAQRRIYQMLIPDCNVKIKALLAMVIVY
jgi:hypothetical protein